MPFLNITSNFRNLKFNSGKRYIPSTTPSFTTVLDLQTTLTSLQFGNDRPGYGSSGLPYIQTQIPGEFNSPGLFKPIFRPTSTGNLDYPIRGGDINFQVGQESFTLSANIDSIRIQKFFKDAPRGTAFINKQIGLQLTNPKIETGNTLFGLGQASPVPGLLENTRVYNQGRNTLAQILASGTGAHAVRHGLTPFAPFQRNYYATVNAQNVNNQQASNRLLNLTALKMTTSVSPFVNPENVLDINLINTLGISLNRNLLFQYLGGPGSSYGVGNTTLPRYVDTTKTKNSRVMGYDLIRSQKVNNITEGKATTNIQDFRNQVFEQGNLDVNDPNVRKTFAGRWVPEEGVDFRFFVKSENGLSKIDALNASYPFIFDNKSEPWTVQDDQSTDDLIKFVFECISNDNPDYSLALFFRAHLTAGINDTNSADINSFRYLGRGENFYTYQGFQRSIGFSFRMAAQSRQELIPMYNRLNSLISQVYPDYSDAGVMRAPVVRLTIGDYLYRTPGILESVNVTVDNGYPWEINLDNSLAQLPQVVDVSVSFKPILDELPRRTRVNKEFSLESTQFETTITSTVTKDNPQLIANNSKVIEPSSTSKLQSSVFNQPSLTIPPVNSRIRENQAEAREQQERDRIREKELDEANAVRGTTLSERILGPKYPRG